MSPKSATEVPPNTVTASASERMAAHINAHQKPSRAVLVSDYRLADEELLTTEETAAYLKYQPLTVKRWRYANRGPVYLKIGTGVRYRKADIDAWLSETRQGASTNVVAEQ